MRKFHLQFAVVLYGFFILIFLAYFEYFGEQGFLFYLIHTPPHFLFIPSLLYLGWQWYKKKSLIPLSSIIVVMYIVLIFFAGRTPIFAQQVTSGVNKIRVCSWNTAYFFKWGREDGFAKLKATNCDYILLQEVWQADKELDAISSMKLKYLPDFDIYTEDEFLILTPKGSKVMEITSEHAGHFGITTTYKEKEFSLISVHLWNPITPKPVVRNGEFSRIPANIARNDQKNELLNEIREVTSKKESSLLVVGDFNTMQNGKVLRDIQKYSNKSNELKILSLPFWKSRSTYSTSFRLIQIDYAFLSKTAFRSSKLQTSCKTKASDHCLLIIDLVL
ncbi:endonuclease/exonuclease/phosphatase family protein [bacterium]|nr:endonuclease/exonuclease/phosphatase family protein [bacterium]